MSEDWSRCSQFLQPALDLEGKWSLDQARGFVERGEALFWPGRQSAALTESIHDVRVWSAGGDLGELLEMEKSLDAYARAMGADVISISGRKGWDRVLASRGYRTVSVLVKDLKA